MLSGHCCNDSIKLPSLTSCSVIKQSCPMERSVAFIILFPQKEKPQALTGVFVSNFNNVVPVSQSQYRRLLSADPEINFVVSPEGRVKAN